MQFVYFTVIGIFLYLVSDWILQRIERHFQKRLENREIIFFLILTTLAISSFALLRSLNLT